VAAWEKSLGGNRFVDSEKALVAVEGAVMDGVQPARLRVYHSPGHYTVRPGETLSSISTVVGIPYPWIEQANPGVSDSLRVGQVLAIPSPDVLLPLPVVENKRIVVSLSQQRMWAYQDGALLWEWSVSTGIASSPTTPGVFQVQSHNPNAYAASWDLWMPHFIGIYRPVPTSDFMNGFHGFPTRDGATLLWTGNLGYPVTYGCILLGNEGAPRLYQWAEEGVVVEIRQ
jgi:LysM repeat protein